MGVCVGGVGGGEVDVHECLIFEFLDYLPDSFLGAFSSSLL